MAETRIAETTVPKLGRVRSMLFMPGNRAEMIAKIPRFSPDVAVADLEDAAAVGCAAVGVAVPKLETSTQLAQVRDVHVRMARAVLAPAEPARAERSSGERPS
jgi:citrate lyase subunit beta / citryl-CoA lyase